MANNNDDMSISEEDMGQQHVQQQVQQPPPPPQHPTTLTDVVQRVNQQSAQMHDMRQQQAEIVHTLEGVARIQDRVATTTVTRMEYTPRIYVEKRGDDGAAFRKWLDNLFSCAELNGWTVQHTHNVAKLYIEGDAADQMAVVTPTELTTLTMLKEEYKKAVLGIKGAIKPYAEAFGMGLYRRKSESLIRFATRLKEAWTVIFPDWSTHPSGKVMVTKAFIEGINDNYLREKILDKAEMPFEKTVEFARTKLAERAERANTATINGPRGDDPAPYDDDINKVDRSRSGKGPITCYECNKKGHMAKECWSKNGKPGSRGKSQGKLQQGNCQKKQNRGNGARNSDNTSRNNRNFRKKIQHVNEDDEDNTEDEENEENRQDFR